MTKPQNSNALNTITTAMRRGMLSALFGIAAMQGLAAPAQARTPAAAAPDTAATRGLDAMARYYDRLRRGDAAIMALDTDRLVALNLDEIDDGRFAKAFAPKGDSIAPAGMEKVISHIDYTDTRYNDVSGIDLESQVIDPRAVTQVALQSGGQMCLVIASPEEMPVTLVPGMTAAQSARYFNRHEFWHCIDPVAATLEAQLTGLTTDDGLTPAVLDGFARMSRTETYADLGALADMVALDGADPSVIARVRDWRGIRLHSARDLQHYDGAALTELQHRIEDMGVERFRRLSDRARLRMVEDIARTHSYTAGALGVAVYGILGADVPDEIVASAADRAMAQQIVAAYKAGDGTNYEDVVGIELTAAQVSELNGWDASAALEALATRQGPETVSSLLAARVQMLDGLRADITRDPENPMYGARIILVQRAFQERLTDLQADAAPAAPAPVKPAMAAAAGPSS